MRGAQERTAFGRLHSEGICLLILFRRRRCADAQYFWSYTHLSYFNMCCALRPPISPEARTRIVSPEGEDKITHKGLRDLSQVRRRRRSESRTRDCAIALRKGAERHILILFRAEREDW